MAGLGNSGNNESIPAWLLESLECPVCLDPIMESPIFLCANEQKHSLCLKCFKRLKNVGGTCPVCRAQLTGGRNQKLEEIVEKVPKWTCKYEGCGFKRPVAGLVADHEENDCKFRSVPCGECDSLIKFNKFLDHLAGQHKREKIQYQYQGCLSTFIPLESMQKAQGMGVSKGNVTFLDNWAELDDTCYIFWMAYYGPKKEAENYKYTIRILSSREKESGTTKYVWESTAYCVPCDISLNEMKMGREGIILPKKMVQGASAGNVVKLNLAVEKDD